MLLANLHAYLDDEKYPWGEMDCRAGVYQTVFELLGLDDASFVRGSSFQRLEAYIDDLYRALGMVTGNRVERAASEVVRGDAPTLGSLTYPVMQSLDCEHLNVDLALGGSDQRHVYMLTRELLPQLGGEQVCFLFTPLSTGPDAERTHAAEKSRIELWASPEQVTQAIEQAYCPPDAVEQNPVLEYATHFGFPQLGECHVTRPAKYGGNVHYDRPAQLVEDFRSGDLHPADLKQAVATGINEALQPVREYFREQRAPVEDVRSVGTLSIRAHLHTLRRKEERLMDRIADNLFVGAMEDAGDGTSIQTHKITTIVSLTYGDPDRGYPPGIDVTKLPMKDGPQNDRETFERAVRATLENLRSGERVLIHCSAGASRSVAVAAAAIGIQQGCDIDRAFEMVAEQRTETSPHPALRRRAEAVLAEQG